jgi:hypothetical protein
VSNNIVARYELLRKNSSVDKPVPFIQLSLFSTLFRSRPMRYRTDYGSEVHQSYRL